MKYLVFIFALSLPAKADDLSIFLGGWSKHINHKKEYNETHNMITVQYKNIMFSPYYKNSYGDASQYLGYYNDLYKYESFKVWYTAGFVNGYKHTIISAQVGYTFNQMVSDKIGIGFNISLMPIPDESKIKGVVVGAVSVKYKF